VLILETDYSNREKISMLKNMRALPNWDTLIAQDIKWPIYTAAICRNPECSRMGEPYLPENSTSAMYLVYCSQECQIEYDPKRRAKDLKPRVCANPDCINGGGKGGVTYQPQRLNSRHCEHACYLDWYYRNVTKPKNGPLLCEQVKKVTPNFGKHQVKTVTAKFSKDRVKKIITNLDKRR
jgi:hypothetical protein